jgi:two-component system, chemotaxis family, protein-glutamate methylesterase/glutaminase
MMATAQRRCTDMPESAIDSGCTDFILAPEEIGKEIARVAAT